MPGPAITHDPAREQAELSEYLGGDFELLALQQSDRRLEREFREAADEGEFYRASRAYLYNLTAFAMTTTKLPYLAALTRSIEPGARILDYGCGIGSDGLLLLEAGYAVEFADFDNPSVEYLRWRLARRNLSAPIHDLDGTVPGGFDAAFSFDVLEHVPDAAAALAEIERRADLVCVNLLAPIEADQELHHELDLSALLRRAAGFDLRHYKVHHSRSHLLLYRSRPVGPLARLRNRLRLVSGSRRRDRSADG